jgi:ssDNA thymidine ADP-ribosyltransferase, DarT
MPESSELMPRPKPTVIMHFTHASNIPTVASEGLLCDTGAGDYLLAEVGNRGIKAQRRERVVATGPRGVVGDYVPFYFAPRSPMLYAIKCGRVPEYAEGQDPIVYLVTTVERLTQLGLKMVFTDRNAALAVAKLTEDLADLDDLVDWELMKAEWWNNTPEDPDRRERRMAECLVHDRVPFEAFVGIVTRNTATRDRVMRDLEAQGEMMEVVNRSGWYF